MSDFKLLNLPYGENYIQNRIDRFYQEFLGHEINPEDIDRILATIHDYLLECDNGESQELYGSIVNLRQCIYWLQSWSAEEFDIV